MMKSIGRRRRLYSALAVIFLALLVASPGAHPAVGGQDAEKEILKVENAIRVLEEMMKESDKSIPLGLLERCAGIAVIPDVIRAGLVIGARHGKGVLLVRKDGAGWSDPVFIDIKGGSLGWQVGVQSADVVLVFMTGRSIENIAAGQFTLGADAGVAAGPLGRQAEASTDTEFKAEILSYSRSRGLYAGITLQGSSIQVDRKANGNFYGRDGITARDILDGKAPQPPAVAAGLKRALAGVEQEK
ncbi:MAG: lipid-binding SYLF domain-containing protein [Candidatus Aminicenantes bacterium]